MNCYNFFPWVEKTQTQKNIAEELFVLLYITIVIYTNNDSNSIMTKVSMINYVNNFVSFFFITFY